LYWRCCIVLEPPPSCFPFFSPSLICTVQTTFSLWFGRTPRHRLTPRFPLPSALAEPLQEMLPFRWQVRRCIFSPFREDIARTSPTVERYFERRQSNIFRILFFTRFLSDCLFLPKLCPHGGAFDGLSHSSFPSLVLLAFSPIS